MGMRQRAQSSIVSTLRGTLSRDDDDSNFKGKKVKMNDTILVKYTSPKFDFFNQLC